MTNPNQDPGARQEDNSFSGRELFSDETTEPRDDDVVLGDVLAKFSPGLQEVIRRVYGLEGAAVQPPEEVAKELNMSLETVNQIREMFITRVRARGVDFDSDYEITPKPKHQEVQLAAVKGKAEKVYASLSPLFQEVADRLYGLKGKEPQVIEDVARDLGLSLDTASRMEKFIITKLQSRAISIEELKEAFKRE